MGGCTAAAERCTGGAGGPQAVRVEKVRQGWRYRRRLLRRALELALALLTTPVAVPVCGGLGLVWVWGQTAIAAQVQVGRL